MSSSGGRSGQPPSIANSLSGFVTTGSAGGPTTLLTVPAGRTWVGQVMMACSVQEVAAGTTAPIATITLSVDGTGAPAAGSIMRLDAQSGANAAGGTTGDGANNSLSFPLTIIAPAGSAVDLQYTTGVAGSAAHMSLGAVGFLQ